MYRALKRPSWRCPMRSVRSGSAETGDRRRVWLPDDTSAPATQNTKPGEYRVSELDQMKMAPATLSKSRGRTSGLCDGSPVVGRPPLQLVKVIDMHQGTRTLPPTHRTPPWCRQRVSDGWPFGGVFVLSMDAPVRPSVEGARMT